MNNANFTPSTTAAANFLELPPGPARLRKATRCFKLWLAVLVAAITLLCFTVGTFVHGINHSPIFQASRQPVAQSRSSFRGVNLGGWLVVEPWITPSLFYPFLCSAKHGCDAGLPPVIDESSFCERLGIDEAQRQLDAHRERWVNRSTFERIASMELNVVRIPFGHWIFGDATSNVCRNVTSIRHLDNAIDWAEAVGVRVILDLHAVSAGANGMDNSGVSYKPPWRGAWLRPPFAASAWATEPAHVNVTRNVLLRIAARYANRSATVVRIGLVNEPLLGDQPLWCVADCPMQLEELLQYDSDTWQAIDGSGQRPAQVRSKGGLGAFATSWRWLYSLPSLPSLPSSLPSSSAFADCFPSDA